MPFRFLDLPGELRNRIYEIVAHEVEDTPVSVFDKESALEKVPRQGSKGAASYQRILDRLQKATSRPLQNRFALAQTCRKVRREVRSMLHAPSKLDLQYLMLRSSLKEMTRLTKPSKIWNLHAIRHFEIDLHTLMLFMTYPLNLHPMKMAYWEDSWKHLCGAKKSAPQEALNLLKGLSNVESITVHASGTWEADDDGSWKTGLCDNGINNFEAAGVEMALELVEPLSRACFEEAFPRLSDIRCISERGGERFRKSNGGWQLWYTRQPLPTFAIPPWDKFSSFDWDEVQESGGLLPASMVEVLPPVKKTSPSGSQ